MNPIFHPRLVNGPFEDPALYVDFRWEKRAFFFDIGTINGLQPRRLLKVSDVFVSHTHIDHFIGFDTLFRVSLGREKTLRFFGPVGFIKNLEGKINSYTWNLIEDYPLSIEVNEVLEERIERVHFRAKESFKRVDDEPAPFSGLLIDEPAFFVRAVHLDHRTQSLAYSLKEKKHINVRKDALNTLGLSVGPWIKDFKDRIREGADDNLLVTVPLEDGGSKNFTIKELCEKIIAISEGQKITYVVDAVYKDSNVEKIVELAKGSDILFCEATFLHRDRDRALSRSHLTARQAGLLARQAGVKRLEILHFSPRYQGLAEEMSNEAMEAFKCG